MSWYLIEMPDGELTPYVTETDSGTVYGWGEMPKRKVDLIALMFAVSVAVIVSNVVTARSECRTNRELLRVQREWMERMTDDKRD